DVKPKRLRGPTRLLDVWDMAGGDVIIVNLDKYGCPVDDELYYNCIFKLDCVSLTFNNPFPTVNNSHSQRTLSFTTKTLALPKPLSSYTTHSPQPSSHYISTAGSSSLNLPHWNLTHCHLTLLQVLAVVVTSPLSPIPNIDMHDVLFCSAIPTLLAFKRAAEISDVTNELGDLGQEITQGVKSSTRVVRSAEERFRRLTTMIPSSSVRNFYNAAQCT
ncbi:hypothetical protein L195_g042280, partial [Trifolium pratense]